MIDTETLEGTLYIAGTRGYSNYEIAVQNGFEGTEEEWLQSMFDYAGEIAGQAVIEKILDGTFEIGLMNTLNAETQELDITIGLLGGNE